MKQNYLVIGTIRENDKSHESISHLIYYEPSTSTAKRTSVADVIKKIKNNEAFYFTHENGKCVNIRVVDGRYVRTSSDNTTKDNLLNLSTYVNR